MRSRIHLLQPGVIAGLLAVTVSSIGQSDFKPDSHFSGSGMSGWQSLGSSDWKVQNGEVSGTGLLVRDGSFQDLQLFTEFKCEGTCDAGIISRIKKNPDGTMSGILASLTDGTLGTYGVTFDSQGKELTRQKLTAAPPEFGPPPGRAPDAAGGGGRRGAQGAGAPAAPPGGPPAAEGAAAGGAPRRPAGGPGRRAATLKPSGEWNSIEVLVDDQNAKLTVNGAATPENLTGEDGYGDFALYNKGEGVAHFRSIAWNDLNKVVRLKEVTSHHYTKQQISDFYYGWDAAAADINHDGTLDIVSGPFYYTGPDYTVRHRYRSGRTYNPSSEYAPDMINFSYDFNGDGWPDILASDQAGGSRPLDLYINPKGENRRWDKYRVVPNISTELVLMKDIDGDGRPEIIFGGDGVYAYAKPDPQNITAPWTVHQISGNLGRVNNHGMGVGDINGDGRMDLITPIGWYEQPEKGSGKEWTFHATSFGGGGGEMGIYDVNGDGLVDVVTSLEAHGFGLAWYEQKRDNGQISFVEHKIAGDYSTKNAGDVTFSQPHSSRFVDVDGDGIPDFVVGKSFFHHLETFGDPDIYGPPVLYVYRTVRNPNAPGGAEFVPELIDNHSGVGSAFEIADLNKDGVPDIITQTGLGTFIFYGKDKHWPKVSVKK
jgi:Domain of Unknown Function (DUF1080)/FG-GAP-like repeat